MAKACPLCYEREHCAPDCPSLFWTELDGSRGSRRGDNPGKPPAASMLLQDEMTKIFANVNVELEEA